MTRTRRTLLAIVLGITTALAVTLGSAHAGVGLQCGETVVSDLKLTDDLGPCPGHGLVVGAHGITIDLDGYSILGQSGGTGIDNSGGYDGVTIAGVTMPKSYVPGATDERGTIENFDFGVRIVDGVDNRIIKLRILEPGSDGVEASGVDRLQIRRALAVALDDVSGEGFDIGPAEHIVIHKNIARGAFRPWRPDSTGSS